MVCAVATIQEILNSFRTVINNLFSIDFLECFVEFIVYSSAVFDFNESCIFIAFWQIRVIIRVLLLDQHYLVISPLIILEVQEGFTRPFIFKNTEVLPVLKGLGCTIPKEIVDRGS